VSRGMTTLHKMHPQMASLMHRPRMCV
jgi:hypothetical protein